MVQNEDLRKNVSAETEMSNSLLTEK